jgi:hypothetical protein
MATVTRGKTWVSGDELNVTTMNEAALPVVVLSDNEVTTAKILDGNVTAGKLATTLDLSGKTLTIPTNTVVSASNLATGAVTGAAGGGKLAVSSITGQTLIADPLASGDEFLVHDTSAAALRRVAYSALMPVGTTLQTVQASTSSKVNVTSTLTINDTAPTSASGTEILSQSITLSSASNKVLVRAFLWGGDSANLVGLAIIVRDSTVIQVSGGPSDGGADFASVSTEILDSPATAGSVTYSLRAAVSAAGTWRINGAGSLTDTRIFGGKNYAVLTLQEIKG